jgi:hypothetical protein
MSKLDQTLCATGTGVLNSPRSRRDGMTHLRHLMRVEPTRVIETGNRWGLQADVMLSTLNAYIENTSSPEVTHSGVGSLLHNMGGGMNAI